jgi:hypothetical protein
LPPTCSKKLLSVYEFGMKTYQDNKNGDRTSPEFEEGVDFFIPVDVILLEIEVCSEQNNGTVTAIMDYRKEMEK